MRHLISIQLLANNRDRTTAWCKMHVSVFGMEIRGGMGFKAYIQFLSKSTWYQSYSKQIHQTHVTVLYHRISKLDHKRSIAYLHNYYEVIISARSYYQIGVNVYNRRVENQISANSKSNVNDILRYNKRIFQVISRALQNIELISSYKHKILLT